jgi:hypothetical protein
MRRWLLQVNELSARQQPKVTDPCLLISSVDI